MDNTVPGLGGDENRAVIADMVHRLLGYTMTGAEEEEIAALTGRDVEDVALDFNIERCQECGLWTESCEMNEERAGQGEVVCLSCAPENDEED